jgi:hypothetical protein
MAQESKRTSARYDPNCDGTFFIAKDRSEVFQQAVVTVFEQSEFWEKLTVTKVLDSPIMLMKFADEVRSYLLGPCREQLDRVAIDKLVTLGGLDVIQVDGYSFCNHVAKRLLRSRKAGKLRPRGTFKGPSKFEKSPDAERRSTGGTIIQGLE